MNNPPITRAKAKELEQEQEAFNAQAKLIHTPPTKPQTITKSNINIPVLKLEETNNSTNNSGNPNTQENTGNPQLRPESGTEQQELTTMANQVQLKDALRVVPQYDGEKMSLTDFCSGLDESLAMIDTNAEANLVRIIRSKLIGEARRSIRNKTFANIEALKTHLKTLYFASKTVFQLQGELGSLFQGDEESVSKFANRVVDCGETIIEVYKLENNPSNEDLTAFKITTNNNVRKSFKRGLKADIEQRLQDSDDIDILVTRAIATERELIAKESLRKQTNNYNQQEKKSKLRFAAPVSQIEDTTTETPTEVDSEDEIETKGLNYQVNANDQKKNFKDFRKCDFCFGAHRVRECPQLADKRKELEKTEKANAICGWCLVKGHSLKSCYSFQNEYLNHIKTPQTEDKPEANKLFCNYCKESTHKIEHCPKRPKTDSWRSSKNDQLPTASSDQKGAREIRSLNLIKADYSELLK
jgi:hypothetical protein